MEKQVTINLSEPPFSPIIEEIYENVGELIYVTIAFKSGWEFRGVMTKESFMKKSMGLNLCTQPHTGTLFMLEIPEEDE